ncbi:hypothetical protein HPP92_028159, partial [Vanilla planifolia]
TIDCKYFDLGNDTCPFGTNCFYKENTEWVDWHASVLVKQNAMENIHNWACGWSCLAQATSRLLENHMKKALLLLAELISSLPH